MQNGYFLFIHLEFRKTNRCVGCSMCSSQLTHKGICSSLGIVSAAQTIPNSSLYSLPAFLYLRGSGLQVLFQVLKTMFCIWKLAFQTQGWYYFFMALFSFVNIFLCPSKFSSLKRIIFLDLRDSNIYYINYSQLSPRILVINTSKKLWYLFY